MASYDIASPLSQQVLELRRLRAEAGLEPYHPRDLRIQRKTPLACGAQVISGKRLDGLSDRLIGDQSELRHVD